MYVYRSWPLIDQGIDNPGMLAALPQERECHSFAYPPMYPSDLNVATIDGKEAFNHRSEDDSSLGR
jgi:hypothetical protein